MTLTFEHIMQACSALGDISIHMRKPGDWYVSHRVEVRSGSILEGRYGNGVSPIDAIHDHWKKLTELKPHEYIVLNAMGADIRRAFRWNGFMWQEVEELEEP